MVDELLVATPERVTFGYPAAGIGSRFLAQLIDLGLLACGLIAISFGAVFLFALLPDSNLPAIILAFAEFAAIWLYFGLQEAAWSGQTVGKKALRLRVVGMRGEPITFSQAAIRNIIRIVDFLPGYYVLGLIVAFISPRTQRLGDWAAGTIVVRERQAVGLRDLLAAASRAEAAAAQRPPVLPGGGQRQWLPQLRPELRRFVVGYAGRREELSPERREELARRVAPALRLAAPQVVAERGPLGTLELFAAELDA
ncbi:MAG TPA: RDD family protein [Candidatus Dormibacteraeota bacterium]|jgi:uncharacterized RDD family membrane protein YckC|nr:RDD family protein [Candidatus Dormibacteraeota bacterium]